MDIHIKKLTADMAKMDNNVLNEPISVKDYVDPPSAGELLFIKFYSID